MTISYDVRIGFIDIALFPNDINLIYYVGGEV